MMHRSLLLSALLAPGLLVAQELYFPPLLGNVWETTDPEALGWCTDQIPPLLQLLEDNDTKAFLVLKDGRIVIEHYFGTFTQDSSWYWASAGKSLTAFLVAMAQEDGLLDINAPSSDYLGTGWTSCTPEQEMAITVRHQLTMTTGLDDSGDVDCTDPACLTYLADPGTRWSYHNAAYTMLDGVIEGATGQNLNSYLLTNLTAQTGIYGLYIQLGYNNVFFSQARAMARFGFLALNQDTWNSSPVLADQSYFTAMTTPSQALNPAYGYLWWLNGDEGFMVPGVQFLFPGSFMPNAPLGAYNAMGKNGQFLNVVPDQGLVLVRMGNAPNDGASVPFLFNDAIWEYMNAVMCTPTSIDTPSTAPGLTLYPNPAADVLNLTLPFGTSEGELRIMDATGRVVLTKQVRSTTERIDLSDLAPGSYRCLLTSGNGRVVEGFMKE